MKLSLSRIAEFISAKGQFEGSALARDTQSTPAPCNPANSSLRSKANASMAMISWSRR